MATADQVAQYLNATKSLYGTMQLQKLVYYAQGWTLAWTGSPLFQDEIEAWKNGPVIRNVWSRFKYGVVPDNMPQGLSEDEKAIIDAVFEFYGADHGARLSEMSHSELPWAKAREGVAEGANSTAPISQAIMRRFFTQKSIAKDDAPIPPVTITTPSEADVAAVSTRQANRWRQALDGIALI